MNVRLNSETLPVYSCLNLQIQRILNGNEKDKLRTANCIVILT